MTVSYRKGFRSRCCSRKDLLAILLGSVASVASVEQAASQQPASSTPENAKTDFAPRGQRAANDIKYGDWRKLCFKAAGTKTLCRTTITGNFETGQTAVRVDLIEREGDERARVQIFLPVGMFLQAGVKIAVDKRSPYQIPYAWCLTNACIAANLAAPKMIREMESGQTLVLEVVDTNILSVTTSIPLAQFASVHKGAPAKIFEQDIDE